MHSSSPGASSSQASHVITERLLCMAIGSQRSLTTFMQGAIGGYSLRCTACRCDCSFRMACDFSLQGNQQPCCNVSVVTKIQIVLKEAHEGWHDI